MFDCLSQAAWMLRRSHTKEVMAWSRHFGRLAYWLLTSGKRRVSISLGRQICEQKSFGDMDGMH